MYIYLNNAGQPKPVKRFSVIVKSMRSKYFFGFTLSFIVGICVEEFFILGSSFAIFCVILSSILFLLEKIKLRLQKSFFVSLIIFGFAVGIVRVDVSHLNQNTHALDALVGTPSNIQGLVVDEPDVREDYTNIVFEAHAVLEGTKIHVLDHPALILVRTSSYPKIIYGDEILLSGKVALPKNFVPEPGTPTFDYTAYLAKDDIRYQMSFAKISVVAHDKGNVIYQKLFALKNIFMTNISHMIPEPQAALAGGVLLGTKQSLGTELLQKFRETGVAHIVVLSGYNIAIVASVVVRAGMFLPFMFRVGLSIVSVILFAMMVGGGSTVVRATIMVLVALLARATGRESDGLRALIFAGTIMVALNPLILFSDVSFQLSFVATLALVTLVPILEKYFLWIKNLTLREIFITTTATQIFVLPLILYHMGSVSLVGLIVNLFVLPVVPLAMLSVTFVVLFSWVPFLNSAFAFVSYFILGYIILVVNIFSKFPLASLHGVHFSLWMFCVSYVCLAVFITKKMPRKILEKKSDYEF